MVHFTGAGPGSPDLITLRGAEALKKADVVIYAGSLVNPALLGYCGSECSVYDSSVMDLDEVSQLMINAAKSGKDVVRLHTGDPSLYGAVREQFDILEKEGIEYEVIPGVSSFCGAAAALKSEYTLPGVSQTVIITRMQGRTPVPDGESISTLASHGCTMVIFLSAGMLPELQGELLKGAYNEETPAVIVYKATWPEEKIIHTTLGKLAEDGRINGIKKTALVIIGDFLGEKYEKSKLYDPTFTTGYRKGKTGK